MANETITIEEQQEMELIQARAEDARAQEQEEQNFAVALEEELGESLEEDDIPDIYGEIPEKHSFPIFIFGLALIADILAVVTLGTLGWVVKIFIVAIVWLWLLGKVNFAQRRVVKKLITRAIPVLSMVYFLSVFVWLAHEKHNKFVEAALNALEHIKVV